MALTSVLLLLAVLTAIYVVMSIGLGIQWGDAGIMNFGLAAFFAIGGYTTVLLTTPPNPSPIYDRTVGFEFPIVVGLVAAFLVTAAVGLVVALSSVRVSGDYLAITLLAFDRIVERIFSTEAWLTNGVRGIDNVQQIFTAGGMTFDALSLILALGIAIAAYIVTTRLSSSSFGRVLRAIREDEEATQALGKNTTKYKLKAFAFGSGLAGVSGALIAHYLGVLSPSVYPVTITFLIWTGIVIGGTGSYRGAVAGTAVIMFIHQAVRFVPSSIPLSDHLPQLRLIFVGVLLIAIMYVRPYGIFGDKERMEAGGISL